MTGRWAYLNWRFGVVYFPIWPKWLVSIKAPWFHPLFSERYGLAKHYGAFGWRCRFYERARPPAEMTEIQSNKD